jgi:hypothetical protein
MSSTCSHDAQIRDLKSRISQLEIMYGKAKRSLDSAHAALQHHTQAPPPQPQSRPALLDPRAEEVKRLTAQLEQEQKVKIDLMANLKQLSDSHAAEKANLAREIQEISAERLAASQELKGVQEAFDELCGIFDIAQNSVSGASIRAAVAQIEAKQDAQTQSLLSAFMPDLDASLPAATIAKQVEAHIKNLEERASNAASARESMTTAQQQMERVLYEIVPSAWSDLYILLNREPFKTPEKPFDVQEYDLFIAQVKKTVIHTVSKYITSHKQSRQKLCYRSFVSGDLALFLPTNLDHSQAWAAFNVGAPHYFLDMNGVDIRGKDFVIGRIQEIEERSGEPGNEAPATGSEGEPKVWYHVKIQEKRKH